MKEGTKPKIAEFRKAELWVGLDNQVIIQIFNILLLLLVDEQQEDSKVSKGELQKPLKL